MHFAVKILCTKQLTGNLCITAAEGRTGDFRCSNFKKAVTGLATAYLTFYSTIHFNHAGQGLVTAGES